MREDIEVRQSTCDVVLGSTRKYAVYPFQWVENQDGEQDCIYGEILVPSYIPGETLRREGLCVAIPYTPEYKKFKVRIRTGESESYLDNQTDGSYWFTAKVGLYGGEAADAYASQLMLVSEGALFVRLTDGYAMLYDADDLDFHIAKANTQNGKMLLACVPTNNYRYPVTGVGLVRWTNSNIEYTNLTEILQREFVADGVTVMNASYDYNTKDLYLDLDTTFVDSE